MDEETKGLLMDSLKESNKSGRLKDRIIVLLSVLCVMLVLAVVVMGLITYDTMTYEYVETTTTDYDETIDMSSSGDSASVEYNDVTGDQYNDNATHNEGGGVE